MLSVTTRRPPCSNICIIRDVPERGRPETIMISAFMATLSPRRIGRLDTYFEYAFETKCSNHRYDEPIPNPGVRSVDPGRPLGILDFDGLRRRVWAEWLFGRMQQYVFYVPSGTQHADAHDAVADGDLLFVGLIADMKQQSVIAVLRRCNVPTDLPLALYAHRPG